MQIPPFIAAAVLFLSGASCIKPPTTNGLDADEPAAIETTDAPSGELGEPFQDLENSAEVKTGEAGQPIVRSHPVLLPSAVCGAAGYSDAAIAVYLVQAWTGSAWGLAAGIPFAAWQQAGCPVNTGVLLPIL